MGRICIEHIPPVFGGMRNLVYVIATSKLWWSHLFSQKGSWPMIRRNSNQIGMQLIKTACFQCGNIMAKDRFTWIMKVDVSPKKNNSGVFVSPAATARAEQPGCPQCIEYGSRGLDYERCPSIWEPKNHEKQTSVVQVWKVSKKGIEPRKKPWLVGLYRGWYYPVI